jgi:predicted NUDIX family NTP pyrophosphohydrolase
MTEGETPELLVFLAHMGGPFWAPKDAGAWSIPKGEFDANREDPADAAGREFAEEIGLPPPQRPWIGLGSFPQSSGKVITAYAAQAQPDLQFRASNEFEMEWPRGSGRVRSFPEVDTAQWFDVPTATVKLVPGQVRILDALRGRLGEHRRRQDQ